MPDEVDPVALAQQVKARRLAESVKARRARASGGTATVEAPPVPFATVPENDVVLRPTEQHRYREYLEGRAQDRPVQPRPTFKERLRDAFQPAEDESVPTAIFSVPGMIATAFGKKEINSPYLGKVIRGVSAPITGPINAVRGAIREQSPGGRAFEVYEDEKGKHVPGGWKTADVVASAGLKSFGSQLGVAFPVGNAVLAPAMPLLEKPVGAVHDFIGEKTGSETAAELGTAALQMAALHTVGKTGGRFVRGFNKSRASALPAEPKIVGPTEYGMGPTRILGEQPKPMAAPREPVILKPQEGLVSEGDIRQLRAETRAAQGDAAGTDIHNFPKRSVSEPVEPTPETRPELFDEMGLRRTRTFRPGERGSFGFGARDRPMPMPGDVAENLGAWVGEKLPGKGRIPTTLGDLPKVVRGGPFKSTLDQIGEYGKHGQELRFRAIDADVDARSDFGRLSQPLLDAWKKLSSREREVMETQGESVAKREVPLTPAQEAFVAEWHKAHGEANRINVESGIRVNDEATGRRTVRVLGEKFFPHQLKPEILEGLVAEDPALVAEFARLNGSQGGPFGAPMEARAGLARWREAHLKPTNPGTEMPRQFRYPAEWLNQNFLDAAMSYLERSTRSAAENRHFKYADPKTGELLNAGQGEYGNLLAELGKEYGGGAAEGVDRMFQSIMGRDPNSRVQHNRWWHKAQRLEGNFTAGAKLGGSLVSMLNQTSQLPNLASFVGTRNTLRGLKGFAEAPRESWRTARVEGAAPRLNSYSGTAGLDLPSRVGSLGRRAVDATTKGVAFMDGVFRTVASEASGAFAESLGRQLREGGSAAETARRVLDGMGMRPEEIARLHLGEATPRDMVKLRQRTVVRSQIEANRGELPSYAGNPNAQTFLRLKKFGIGQTRYYLQHVLGEARHGNFKPLANAVAWSLAVGEAIGNTKEAAFGPNKRRKDMKTLIETGDGVGVLHRLADDLDNAAAFGLIGQMTGKFAEAATDDRGRDATKAHPVLRFVLPPSVGTATDLWDVATDPSAEQAMELLRNQFAAVNQAERAVQFNTTDGLLKEIQRRSTNEGMPRKGQEDYVRRLRERRK